MPELIPAASEAEWLEARRKGVTASEIAVLMGLSPYSSPYALYHQKLGILPEQADQAVFERGRVLEPYVVEKFAASHPEFAILGTGRDLYAHPDRLWQLATPDRMVHGIAEVDACTCGADLQMHYGHEPRCGQELDRPVAVAEFKTDDGSDEWGEPGTDEIPVHYRAQVLWQMDVMGVRKAHVSCLRIHDWKIRDYVVEHTRSPLFTGCKADCKACDDIELMRDAARDFLDRIDRQEPPDVDWRPATIGALKQLHPSVTDEDVFVGSQLAVRYRAAAKNLKYWEQRKKLYEARLRLEMGSAHRAWSGGEVIARRDVYEVSESVRRGYTVDKLVPVKPKKES
jgi:putative phage-type endonuclease